ncbi:MAG TPA: hypothetical protein VHP33_10570 [Polyangiaceae bacterium]|nr:hypothetical protein [Polyangiaceae bacterium]
MGKRSLAVLLVGAALAWGCGKTNADRRDRETSGGDGTAEGARPGGTAASDTGATNQGAAASGGATSMGGAVLSPDGSIPSARPLHKLDLLLMVDNSLDMAEKQRLLKDAVSWMLGADGPPLSADDVHVGVVTSSLGSFGAQGAKDVCVTAQDNDHAHLLGSLRPGLETFQNSGFLAWAPDVEADRDTALAQLAPMLDAVGEQGCGYEASLEAWYRFLVDPEPPGTVAVPFGSSQAIVQDIDATVLAQRAAFLRPDSVLAIVVLSDENDCSVVSEGYGWLVTRAAPMYRGTSACQENPNDKCCQSCAETTPNAGCPSISTDPACALGNTLPVQDDDLNLRCWEQKRRYGFELLYPIERYQQGLTDQLVLQRSTAQLVANPIFAGRQRHPSQVIFSGIVGVPWQDLADKASLGGPGLTLLTAAGLAGQKRWELMLGDPAASPPVRALDPFMLETPLDRSTSSSIRKHPLTGDETVPSTSLEPGANAINGHETDTYNRNLQAACIFPRATPKVCDEDAFNTDTACRCFQEDLVYNNPVCQPPGGGQANTTQYYEAAYPGVRHLQLLKSLGNNAVPASICPKVLEPDHPDFGYRPAMRALAARVQGALAALP